MALKLIREVQSFIGVSSDPFPGTADDGAILHIIDTGEEYIFHDGKWERDMRLITALRAV